MDDHAKYLTRRALLTGATVAGAALVAAGPAAHAAPSNGQPGRARSRQVLPSDRQGFNRRWFASNLQRVYLPEQPADVAPCLEAAVATHGRGVKVVSGRHCYEDFAYNDTTTSIIDMSALGQAGYDDEHQAYFVDAGCDNWSAYRKLLNAYGRTLPDGSCASVGAGGHITGGGYGLLSRLHGLSVDHVTAVDIVTWDDARSRATLRHVTTSSTDADERDLLWAVRGGGGGNFGIITRFYFADPPVAPAYASLWTVAWDWAGLDERRFASLLDRYAEWVASMPRGHFSLLKLQHRAAGQVSMLVQMASAPGASLDAHIAEVGAAVASAQRRLAGVGPVARGSQRLQHLTMLEALWTLNGNGPNQFGKYKSAYLRTGMTSEQIAATYEGLHRVPAGLPAPQMAQSLVQVDSYGGAVNDHRPESSAVPQRSSLLKLQYQTYWNNASPVGGSDVGKAQDQQQAHLEWIRDLYQQTYAATGGTPNPARDASGVVQGCYVNYPDVDLGTNADGRIDQALWLYYLDNYRANPRNLVSVKARWDPSNLFQHAQSIPTA